MTNKHTLMVGSPEWQRAKEEAPADAQQEMERVERETLRLAKTLSQPRDTKETSTPTTPTTPAIEELMAARQATTQGEWQEGIAGQQGIVAFAGDDVVFVASAKPENRAFIILAHTLLPAVAAEMERLQERNAFLEGQFNGVCEAMNGGSFGDVVPYVKSMVNELEETRTGIIEVREAFKRANADAPDDLIMALIADDVVLHSVAGFIDGSAQKINELLDRAAAAEANRDEWHEQHENLLAIYRTAEERILKLRQERDTYKRGYEGREKAKKMWADKARERTRERDQLQGDLNAIAKRVQDIEQSKTKATERELWESIAYHKQMAYRNAQRAERLQTEIYQLEGDKLSMQELIKMGDENTLKYLEQKQERDAAEFAALQSSLQSSESARQAAEANSHQADIIIKDLSMLVKRLCTSKGEKHKEGALDYLRRKGLQGSILRDVPQGSEVKG